MTKHTLYRVLPVTISANGDEPVPSSVAIRYNALQPHGLTFDFGLDTPDAPKSNIWNVSRELLEAGLHDSTGYAHVRIWTEGDDTLVITLSVPQHYAHVRIDLIAIRHILDETYVLVPRGEEQGHFDVDGLIARLLNRG
jgi:hypothetical protein